MGARSFSHRVPDRRALRRAVQLAAIVGLAGATSLLYLPVAPAVGVTAGLPFAVLLAALLGASRRRTAGLAVLVVAGATGLVAADLALRHPAFQRRLHYRPFEQFVRRWPDDARVLRFVPDVDERRELHGDLAAMTGDPTHRARRPYWFKTDRLGYRNLAVPTRPVDVILLGDSFALGEGTSQEATWATRLAASGHEVYDLGMPGGPGREALSLAWALPHLRLRPGATIVWSLFAGNDLWDEDPSWDGTLEPAGPLAQAWEVWRQVRRRSPLRQLFVPGGEGAGERPTVLVRERAGRPFLFYGPYAERAALGLAALEALPGRGHLREALRRVRTMALERGLRVLIVVVPSKEELYPDVLRGGSRPAATTPTAFARLVQHAAADLELLPILDLAPALQAARVADDGEPLYWSDDTHWSPRGHEVAARALHAALTCAPLPAPGAMASAAPDAAIDQRTDR